MPEPDPRFERGIQLFNEGDYFESHESIEEVWLEDKSPYRNFYKGLIQAAAALYQFKRGILGGALRLYRSSRGHLSSYEGITLGVDVKKLLEDLKPIFEELDKSCSNKEPVACNIPKTVKYPDLEPPIISYETS